ncbi:MAG: HAMP domain-containing sensor histidine kinase [Cyanobacteria bacterium J06598_3]
MGEALTQKQDTIIQNWMVKVRGDADIESTHGLASQAILDSLPKLMGAIAHLLSQPRAADIDSLLRHGLDHGALRAKQGYDAEEIAREYSILRTVTFDALEEELLGNEPATMLRAIRLINSAIDKAIALCMQRYTDERLQEVNLLYDELVASNQELDWLVRTEKTHLSHLAHELKSPLSSIIGYSELFLNKREKETEIHPEYVERVLNSGRQLLGIVNETLEISLYQSGQIVLKPGPVAVCEVVTEVATALDILAQQKNLPIAVDCEAVNEPVITDSGRLRQVITNLISNAIRYTESGQITIYVRPVKAGVPPTTSCDLPEEYVDEDEDSVDWWAQRRRLRAESLAVCAESDEVDGDRIEIQVTDTGLGMDVTEQSRVFEPYYQGRAGQQLSASTGLGLAVTHQMVKLLQGSIHLKSEPNVGSTFTITLPMRYEPAGVMPKNQPQKLKYS